METAGILCGLRSHQLPRVVSNSQNASARRSVVDDANATSSVYAVQSCVVVAAQNTGHLEGTMVNC